MRCRGDIFFVSACAGMFATGVASSATEYELDRKTGLVGERKNGEETAEAERRRLKHSRISYAF